MEKRVTVILYGSDRNLWRGAPLQIRVSDLFAEGGPRELLRRKTEGATVELRLELPFDAGQIYGLTFSAPAHRPAWQFVRRLDFIRIRDQVEGDDLILLYLLFDAGLKSRMPRSIDFAAAPGHGIPVAVPGLPAHPDSWKHTRFAAGNVQLSFSEHTVPFPAAGGTARVHSADVDIDLGRGLPHAKEWLENNVFRPGHKTSQALVYALLYAQGILPQYTLDPAPSTTSRAAPRPRSRRLQPKRRKTRRRRSAGKAR